MFTDAALYERVLNAGPEALKNCLSMVSENQALPASDNERLVTGRLAKLSVNNWATSTDDPFGVDGLAEEDQEEVGSSEGGAQDEKPASSVSTPPAVQEEQVDEPKLTPEEIVDLLEQEFGALAPPGEEKLLLETDGAFFKDVVVLGVIHVTTHRCTFHASLLSSQPGYSQKVVKSGTALIHRKGLHRKKRVWLQLDHDMISSFPSSRDEDKIKPLRSILLSAIKEIKAVDWEHPRIIGIVYEYREGLTEGCVEFDTIEAARDWRNELRGMMFLYRRNRRASGRDTFKVAVPLFRLDAFYYPFLGQSRSNGATVSSPVENDSLSDGTLSEVLTQDSETEPPYVVQFAAIHQDPVWDDFMSYVEKAKTAMAANATEWAGSNVYIDFDPRAEMEDEGSEGDELSGLQKSVSNALGIDRTKEFYIGTAHTHRRIITHHGYFAVNAECVGFWSRSITFGRDVCYRIPIARVKGIKGQERCRFSKDQTIVIEVQGRRDLHIHFSSAKKCDAALEQTERFIELARERRRDSTFVASPISESPPEVESPTAVTPPPSATVEKINVNTTASKSPTKATSLRSRPSSRSSSPTSNSGSTPMRSVSSILAPLSRLPSTVQRTRNANIVRALFPKAINQPDGVLLPMPSKHFVCLTIGSRGDVQPYIALGKALQKEGHKVTIVTHEEYKEWVTGFGIGHRTAGGDPGALMKLSVENKMFSPQFFKESISNFRSWLDELLVDSWEQCKDAEVLLESPSAMAGVHIAEALHIPYFRTFTMPWTKTREFPHAFLGPPVESPTFNAASYVLFDNVLWTATSSQINRWRKNTLGISSTDMGHLAQSKIPFIYNFSSAVVPKPLDWGDATAITGYWFLDNPELNWTPPKNLSDFIAKARSDGKALVYIGFGSITVPNPKLVTERLIRAVLKSDVRAIISKGWSSRMAKPKGEDDVVFPKECFLVDRVPHDWLFPQIDAALHHGGAGTTGASLRAGIPTLIRPWFGDQFFWASRVQKLGAGLRVNSLHSSEVASALKKATTDRIMKEKAASVGERICAENGVQSAIAQIYTYLPRAGRDRRSLPK
ncbi:hypothetical protein BGY98DRAFT_1183815 [Russula aff. rugulosa BPL654]|nr:hypothetical protein BGY98DRAFT_1183815 [Russula aff. rugulosa BPL654]